MMLFLILLSCQKNDYIKATLNIKEILFLRQGLDINNLSVPPQQERLFDFVK